jgi:hypothetical protein
MNAFADAVWLARDAARGATRPDEEGAIAWTA